MVIVVVVVVVVMIVIQTRWQGGSGEPAGAEESREPHARRQRAERGAGRAGASHGRSQAWRQLAAGHPQGRDDSVTILNQTIDISKVI